MKKLKKFLLCLIVCFSVLSESLSSYAWVSNIGESDTSDKVTGEYRIQMKLQGWLIYWITYRTEVHIKSPRW